MVLASLCAASARTRTVPCPAPPVPSPLPTPSASARTATQCPSLRLPPPCPFRCSRVSTLLGPAASLPSMPLRGQATTTRFDFTLQRELAGGVIVEAGYNGRWARHFSEDRSSDNVPVMMTLGGQTYAQAYRALFLADQKGATTVAAQPFFETALGGPTSAFCSGYASCSQAVLANEGVNGTQNITYYSPYVAVFRTSIPTLTASGPMPACGISAVAMAARFCPAASGTTGITTTKPPTALPTTRRCS